MVEMQGGQSGELMEVLQLSSSKLIEIELLDDRSSLPPSLMSTL